MSEGRQRNRAIEHVLSRGVGRQPSSSASTDCLDGETLAAWSSGSLAATEARRVEEHLADCARCQSVLAAFVRTEPIAAAATAWWRGPQMRWLVPLATAATVAAIWVALPQRTQVPARDVVQTPTAPEAAERPQSEPRTVLNQPPPSVVPETAPAEAQRPASKPLASAPPERKEESVQQRTQEADSQARAGGRASNELAAPPAPLPPPPAATTPQAATPPAAHAEAVAQDARAPRPLAAAPIEIIAPGGHPRWRIVSGQVQRSTTQGESWDPVRLPSTAITAGHAPTPSVVWLVGKGGAIFRTSDGERFDQVPFVLADDLIAVTATDERQAIVTTADGRRFRTTDRGVTWTQE